MNLLEAELARARLPSGLGTDAAELAAQHQAILEALPVITYVDRLGVSSSNVYISPQVEGLLGYTSEEWAADGELFIKLLHPDDRERVLADDAHTHATGAPLATEYRLIARDGHVVWFRDRGVVADGPGGRFLHGYMLDITEQKTIEAELRRQNAELAALHETTLGLVDGLDLASVLEAIVKRASDLLGTPDAYLYLVEPDRKELKLHVGHGVFEGTHGYRLPYGKGVGGRVWETGRPFVVDDYRAWADRQRDFDALTFRAVAGVPLRNGPEIVGVLGVSHTKPGRTFRADELAVLERFGRLASLALGNARLYEAARQELAERNQTEAELQDAVARLRRSELDLLLSREETIRRLSAAVEFRDANTGEHLGRMGRYCALLADRLGVDEERIELIRIASPLHDVGKIAVPDSVLLKPAPLTAEERCLVERHTEIGHTLLAGSGSPLLDLAATIALTHHEWFDGTGYPRGLKGQEIPVEGRIASVADVFDALTSDRPYRAAFAGEDALRLLREGRGTQFDPVILDAFLDSIAEIAAIRAAPLPAQADVPTAADTRQSAVRLRQPLDPLGLPVLRAAALRAETALRLAGQDRQAVDLALRELCEAVGPELLASVYLREHDRLWLVAQHGYQQVRDGFLLEQGIIARSVREAEAQFVTDAPADPDYIEAMTEIVSELAIPFGPGTPALGGLNMETRTRPLPPGSATAFGGLAAALGAWAEGRTPGPGSGITSLTRLFVEASSLHTVSSIVEFASRTLGRMLELESAQVNLYRVTSGYSLASYWLRPESTLEPLSPSEFADALEFAGQSDTTYSVFSPSEGLWVIWLPLRVAGKVIGALIGSAPRRLDLEQEEVDAATLFAHHAAALIDGAQAFQREQRAAVTDPLTGLLNRSGFHDRFREELHRADRLGRPLSLVLFDCDDLEAVNERGGNALGDLLLQAAGEVVKAHKRPEDVAGRTGGDEFGLLLPEQTRDEAIDVAARLRASLSKCEVEPGLVVRAAFGVASFPEDGETSAGLLRAADRAMNGAKQDDTKRARAGA